MRRFLPLLSLALLAPIASPAHAAEPSTVTITQGVDATTLDPIKVSVTTDSNVQAHIFDELARRSADGSKLLPQLALSWRRIAPTVWEFKLRRGVTFSNGDPFTSADVKFTVEKILEPAYKSQQVPRVDTVARVETPDPYTVHFVTKKPTPLPPTITRPVFIVDGKYWREHGDAYMTEHPIGTGPYVLKSWRRDEAIELEANPKYWGGAPKVAHVVFKPIPEAGTRVAALRTGQTDVITNVPFQYVSALAKGPSTRIATVKSARVLYIAFNARKPGPQANVLVRQALNYAIDVPAIISAVLGGHAYALGEPVPSNYFGYDAALQPYHYDPGRAKALLAKAGYPNGKGLSLVLGTPNGRYNRDKEVGLAVAGQLQAVGIQVEVRPQEWVSYFSQVGQKAVTPLYMLAWGNTTYDADNTLSSLFASDSPLSAYVNPTLDKLIDDGRYELDAAKRKAIYARTMRLLHDQAPWLFLFQYQDIYATSKRIEWQPRPDEEIRVTDMRVR